jgi:hypothetical protein
MYPIVLAIHNVVRWVVLIAGALVVFRAVMGVVNRGAWSGTDRLAGMIYTSSIDLQFLLGLILYIFLSPITHSAFQSFGAAMGNPSLRFFALVHPFYMVLAVVLAHMGSGLSRKAGNDAARFQRALIWYGLSFALVLLGTPWMRPLLPGL